jgi:hypothetical protein
MPPAGHASALPCLRPPHDCHHLRISYLCIPLRNIGFEQLLVCVEAGGKKEKGGGLGAEGRLLDAPLAEQHLPQDSTRKERDGTRPSCKASCTAGERMRAARVEILRKTVARNHITAELCEITVCSPWPMASIVGAHSLRAFWTRIPAPVSATDRSVSATACRLIFLERKTGGPCADGRALTVEARDLHRACILMSTIAAQYRIGTGYRGKIVIY